MTPPAKTFCFLALLVCPLLAIAEDAATPTTVPTTTTLEIPASPPHPALPDPTERTTPFFVQQQNEEAFRELLLAPLSGWIKRGDLALRVYNNLAYQWVDPTVPNDLYAAVTAEHDVYSRAAKILSVVYGNRPSMPSVAYDLELSWMNAQSETRKSTGTLYREYGNPDWLFREVFHLTSPAVVSGFSEITWRGNDKAEDAVWIRSPILGKTRHVLQSNRGDPILPGVLSADDFFVWSGNNNAFQAKVVADKTVFVPFGSLDLLSIGTEDVTAKKAEISQTTEENSAESSASSSSSSSLPPAVKTPAPTPPANTEQLLTVRGSYARYDSEHVMALWNHQTRQLGQGAAWVPTSAVFVPRRVWIVELVPSDAYYGWGKQLLVVDQETLLPAYKLVYDMRGRFSKMVMGAWSLAISEDQKTKLPVLCFNLVVDAGDEGATAMTTQAVHLFTSEGGELLASLRQLLTLAKEEEEKGKEEPQTSPEEAAEDNGGGAPD